MGEGVVSPLAPVPRPPHDLTQGVASSSRLPDDEIILPAFPLFSRPSVCFPSPHLISVLLEDESAAVFSVLDL